jgi:formate dehydrogenase (NADP+) beta subunit
MIEIIINGVKVSTEAGTTVLEAAQKADIYIPRLCSHPDLEPVSALRPSDAIYRGGQRIKNKRPELAYEGCRLCAVQIEGKEGLRRACDEKTIAGMVIQTNTPELQEYRRERLSFILARHPHICLTCAQREGCARFPCSMNTPENERCCANFGHCELQKLADYIGIKPDTPRFVSPDIPIPDDEPLLQRNYNLCIGCTRCVRACVDLRGVSATGFVFDDEGGVVVGTTGPTLPESACRFCTACVEVCPTGALTDKKPYKTVPCQNACPAGIDIPRYVRLIREGKADEALTVIHEKVPFPAILGHVCLHFCENKCRRLDLNEAVAIRRLKRFAAEHDTGEWTKKVVKAPPTSKRIGIIGSGPAGLTAAYYLTKLGHSVTVFEALPVAGGMMRVGIPEHRLPRNVLEKEIGDIERFGVKIITGTRVESLDMLLRQGYDALLLAIGAHRGVKIPLPGADLDGVLVNIMFLREVNLGRAVKIGKRVVVLGGGNVAFDCARLARRLGATEVSVACLEGEGGMLATPDEIALGKEEGIKVYNSKSFIRIAGDHGRVSGVEWRDVRSFKFDQEGKLNLEAIAGSEYIIPADTVIFAIGQLPESEIVTGVDDIKITRRRTIEIDPATSATGKPGVYAAGDAVTGTTSVIEAVAAGRKSAVSIDKFLGGSGLIDGTPVKPEPTDAHIGREGGFSDRHVVVSRYIPLEQRLAGFREVELPLDEAESTGEAARCLRCDLRLSMSKPFLAPKKEQRIKFTAEAIKKVAEIDGVYQLLDAENAVIFIKGTMNLRRELLSALEDGKTGAYFIYETEPMYTKRESELLQQYISQHGQMPEGNREMDDLF